MRFAVAEEAYRESLLSLVGFSDFSKQVVLYSGLVHKLVRCRDDVSLCESGDVDLALAALRFGSWSNKQVRDTRRWEGEEILRLFVLRRALAKCVASQGNGITPRVVAFTR